MNNLKLFFLALGLGSTTITKGVLEAGISMQKH